MASDMPMGHLGIFSSSSLSFEKETDYKIANRIDGEQQLKALRKDHKICLGTWTPQHQIHKNQRGFLT